MTTTWSGISLSESNWTQVTLSGATYSGINLSTTSWSANVVPEIGFAVSSCEITEEGGPFLTMCQTTSGSAVEAGAVPMCEIGEGATLWTKQTFTSTTWTKVEFS